MAVPSQTAELHPDDLAMLLVDGASSLCMLISAAGDGQTLVDKLLFDDLPSADLSILVNGSLSHRVDGNVGYVNIELVHTPLVCELLGLGLDLECKVKV